MPGATRNLGESTYDKFDPASPFDGYKESGSRLSAVWVGCESGWHGVAAYCRVWIELCKERCSR